MRPTAATQEKYWSSIRQRRTPDHPAVVAFAKPKLDFIQARLSPEAHTLLEVGAGSGHLSVQLAERFDLTCLDYSENMLSRNPLEASRKIVGRAEALPFDAGAFDVVMAANLLHHVDQPLAVVREMARVASRHVVLLEPNALNPLTFMFSVLKAAERGALKFRRSYLEKLGRQASLRLRATSVQGAVPPNFTPTFALPVLQRLDMSGVGLYCIAIFDIGDQG